MIKIAMAAPYLARDEEHDLAVRWKESSDQNARNQIAMAHMRLVVSMAGEIPPFGPSMRGLVQGGYVGLLGAAAPLGPERDRRFSTPASSWVRASLQGFILRHWSILPRRRCSSIFGACAPSLPAATAS